MRILTLSSDLTGCFQYRCKIPLSALKRHGIVWDNCTSLPSSPLSPGFDLNALIKLFSHYDLMIVQRLLHLDLLELIKKACFLLSKPLIFETDDDYLHLERHNPCYFSTNPNDQLLQRFYKLLEEGKRKEADAIYPFLEDSRLRGIAGYKKALALFDGITTTTEELRQTLLPYNKNIKVLPNNVEQVFYERDYQIEQVDENNNIVNSQTFGMYNIPAFFPDRLPDGKPVINEKNETPFHRILRVGYTGTSSHIDDFRSIEEYWDRLVKKYADKVWFVYIGDAYFYQKQVDNRKRRLYIPASNHYDTYKFNIRNLDIGIAPLQPTFFNMAKSDIKAVEYGMWGVCPVLPDYVTYSRNWKNQQTAFLYKNGKEFYECMDSLINTPALVYATGKKAQEYVETYRLEDNNTEERINFYEEVRASKLGFKQVTPNKVK